VRTSLQIVGEWSDVRTGVPDGMSISLIAQLCKMECCTKKKRLFYALCIIEQSCIINNTYKSGENTMGGRTSAASHNKYNAKAYDRINLVVRKGQKEQIQEYAKEKGMSLNAYINALIQADMGEHLTPGVVKNLEGDADSVE
jgi:hypothetical protein